MSHGEGNIDGHRKGQGIDAGQAVEQGAGGGAEEEAEPDRQMLQPAPGRHLTFERQRQVLTGDIECAGNEGGPETHRAAHGQDGVLGPGCGGENFTLDFSRLAWASVISPSFTARCSRSHEASCISRVVSRMLSVA